MPQALLGFGGGVSPRRSWTARPYAGGENTIKVHKRVAAPSGVGIPAAGVPLVGSGGETTAKLMMRGDEEDWMPSSAREFPWHTRDVNLHTNDGTNKSQQVSNVPALLRDGYDGPDRLLSMTSSHFADPKDKPSYSPREIRVVKGTNWPSQEDHPFFGLHHPLRKEFVRRARAAQHLAELDIACTAETYPPHPRSAFLSPREPPRGQNLASTLFPPGGELVDGPITATSKRLFPQYPTASYVSPRSVRPAHDTPRPLEQQIEPTRHKLPSRVNREHALKMMEEPGVGQRVTLRSGFSRFHSLVPPSTSPRGHISESTEKFGWPEVTEPTRQRKPPVAKGLPF